MSRQTPVPSSKGELLRSDKADLSVLRESSMHLPLEEFMRRQDGYFRQMLKQQLQLQSLMEEVVHNARGLGVGSDDTEVLGQHVASDESSDLETSSRKSGGLRLSQQDRLSLEKHCMSSLCQDKSPFTKMLNLPLTGIGQSGCEARSRRPRNPELPQHTEGNKSNTILLQNADEPAARPADVCTKRVHSLVGESELQMKVNSAASTRSVASFASYPSLSVRSMSFEADASEVILKSGTAALPGDQHARNLTLGSCVPDERQVTMESVSSASIGSQCASDSTSVSFAAKEAEVTMASGFRASAVASPFASELPMKGKEAASTMSTLYDNNDVIKTVNSHVVGEFTKPGVFEQTGSVLSGVSRKIFKPGKSFLSNFWTSSVMRHLLSMICTLVFHPLFDVWCAALIIFNTVITGLETEYMTNHTDDNETYVAIQYSLNVWYLLELGLRLGAEGRNFVGSAEWRWNLFDTILVVSSVVDMFSTSFASGEIKAGRAFRAIRFFRILRSLKIMRVLKCIRELRKMAYSLASSMQTLFWSLAFLFFVMYTCAIWLTQGAAALMHENGYDEATHRHYGSLGRSTYTLYLAISNGASWAGLVEPLHSDLTLACTFVLYVSICFLGVLNVVTAVFVESAMQSTEDYRDLLIHDRARKKEMFVKHIVEIFQFIDKDQSGSISKDELAEFFDNEDLQLQSYFEALELNATDTKSLFKLMDIDRCGEIDIETFCEGCLKLKGTARSFDLQCLMYELRRGQRRMGKFMIEMRSSLRRLQLLQGGSPHLRNKSSVKLLEPDKPASGQDGHEGGNRMIVKL